MEALKGKKVLVVDDEKNIRRLVQINLERAGYEVMTANDGMECLQKVAEFNPDLIVMDWMMPILSGHESLKRLQANPATKAIPVIMLTAKTQDNDVLKGWQSGCSSYLTKPFSPPELLAFVERILTYSPEEDEEEEKRFLI